MLSEIEEARIVATEIIWFRNRRNNEPLANGSDLEAEIDSLLEERPVIFEIARRRLDARLTAQQEWIKKIAPNKIQANLEDLI